MSLPSPFNMIPFTVTDFMMDYLSLRDKVNFMISSEAFLRVFGSSKLAKWRDAVMNAKQDPYRYWSKAISWSDVDLVDYFIEEKLPIRTNNVIMAINMGDVDIFSRVFEYFVRNITSNHLGSIDINIIHNTIISALKISTIPRKYLDISKYMVNRGMAYAAFHLLIKIGKKYALDYLSKYAPIYEENIYNNFVDFLYETRMPEGFSKVGIVQQLLRVGADYTETVLYIAVQALDTPFVNSVLDILSDRNMLNIRILNHALRILRDQETVETSLYPQIAYVLIDKGANDKNAVMDIINKFGSDAKLEGYLLDMTKLALQRGIITIADLLASNVPELGQLLLSQQPATNRAGIDSETFEDSSIIPDLDDLVPD